MKSPVWQALSWAFVQTLWIGALLEVGAAATRSFLSAQSTAYRYWIAASFLALLAAVPIATFVLELSWLTVPHRSAPALISNSSHFDPATTTASSNWLSVLPWIWIVGWVAVLSRLCAGVCGAQRWRRSSSSPCDRVHRIFQRLRQEICDRGRISIRESAHLDTPVLLGLIRPVILVPLAFGTGLRTEQVELILTHELMHWRRRDPWVLYLQRTIEALVFFHPAVWYVSRWLTLEVRPESAGAGSGGVRR